MKKTLSLVLAFSMLLTLLLPMGALAEGKEIDTTEKLFNELVNKFGDVRGETDAAIKAVKIARSLYDDRSEIKNNLKLTADEKAFLEKKGIDENSINALVNVAKRYIPNETEIKNETELREKYFLLDLFFDQDPSYSKYKSNIKTMVDDIYSSIPQPLKEDLNKYAATREGKVAFFLEFANEFINDKIGTGTYDVQNKKWTNLKLEVTDSQIGRANNILDKQGEDKIQIGTLHTTLLNKLVLEVNTKLVSKELLQDSADLLNRAGLIEKNEINKPTEPTEPPTPGGGGGGASSGGGSTTPATSTPSEVVVPEDPKAPVSATIGKEGTTVTTKDGVANVSVDEGKALATVEALAKKADGREVVLVVKPEGVKGMNANVSLPGSVVLALKDKKVNLEIVAGGVEYSIPHDAIDLSNIEKGSKVEFKSQEIKEDAPVELATGLGEVKNTIELFLEITKGGKTTKVTKFNKTIEVRINIAEFKNHDKLAAYYLDEEDNTLEFVGGYIKDNRIVLRLNHFSKYVLIESTKTFPDIAKHWSKDYVESMIAKNIVDGYSDGTFKPEGKITRAEFVKMVVCALNEDLIDYNEGFKDVKANDWHADYIATAKALGLIDGYADGSFRPDATIKRAEMAAILGKVVDVEIDEKDIDKASKLFKDFADIEEWAKESVAKVYKAGLMNGADGKFYANKDTTRAEAATTVYRLYIR